MSARGAALVALMLVAGCAAETGEEKTAQSSDEIGFAKSGEWTVFALPQAPNPAENISGSVRGYISPEINRTMILLSVRGLPADKTFGAHLHAGACADNKGGGHYQHDGTGVSEENEVWLDITTDATGTAMVINRKDFAVAPEKAKSVVVHANPTDPATGKAGDKLACVDVSFVDGQSGTPSAGKSCSTSYQCLNGECSCGGDKEGTTCAGANDCETKCAVCQ